MRTSAILLLALSFLWTGCGRSGSSSPGGHSHRDAAHAHGTEGDHDHELKTAQITVWMNGYEVFAEHTPPVAGQGTRFITHVSELQTGKPRTNGPVKFTFRKGDATFEHPQAVPERPGIYVPSITFPSEGDWQTTLIIPGETNAHIDLGSIKVFANADAASHAEYPDPPEGTSFLKEQQWKILTKSEPVAKRRVVESLKLPGVTVPRPGFAASVIAPVAGQLLAKPQDELPLPGQKVEAGQLLALLRPSFSEAASRLAESEGEFSRAKAALEKAESSYQRVRKLAEQQAKSERELQDAELALQTARASYDSAAAFRSTYRQLSGGNEEHPTNQSAPFSVLELRAPIGGVINQLGAGLGEPIAADRVIFQILNPDVLWIEARVPETALVRIPNDASASLSIPGRSEFLPIKGSGVNTTSRVFAGLQVDPATRTVPIIYEVPNPDQKLRLGQTVSLHVETNRAEDAIVVPDSAIIEEGGNFVAFVQVSGETFEKREIMYSSELIRGRMSEVSCGETGPMSELDRGGKSLVERGEGGELE